MSRSSLLVYHCHHCTLVLFLQLPTQWKAKLKQFVPNIHFDFLFIFQVPEKSADHSEHICVTTMSIIKGIPKNTELFYIFTRFLQLRVPNKKRKLTPKWLVYICRMTSKTINQLFQTNESVKQPSLYC
jgi:hypothetical protein